MEPISQEEQQNVRNILEHFYGPPVRNWKINIRMYDALEELITKSGTCTRAMHLVPRPWGGGAPAKWAQRQVRQALVRFLTVSENRHYLICMHTAALAMRHRFDEARLGF